MHEPPTVEPDKDDPAADDSERLVLQALLAQPARQRRFPAALERDFRAHMLEEGLRLTRESRWALLLVGPALFVLMRLLVAHLSAPSFADTNLAVLDRALLAACVVMAAIAITPSLPAVRRWYPLYALFTSGGAVATAVIAASAFEDPYMRQICAAGVSAAILLVYSLGVVSVRLSTLASWSGVAAGWLVIRHEGLWLDPPVFLAYAVLPNVIGLLVANLIDIRDRAGFLNARLLQLEMRRVDRYAAEVERLSRQDALTRLANRRGFDEAYAREFALARRQQTPVAVILVDVDHFKAYNDSCGHPAGDRALAAVGAAIRRVVRRAPDLPARYGGEEFVVLLPGTALDAAREIAEDIRRAVRDAAIPHPASAADGVLTASLGVSARVPRADDTPAALLDAADAALYAAKHGGRDRVEVATPPAP